jgi:hypothetical protein
MTNFNHVVLIPTRNRPNLLLNLSESIEENMRLYGYDVNKTTTIVIDDSSEDGFSEENKKVIERLLNHGIRIIYYGKQKQAEFIENLKKYYLYLDKYIFDKKTNRRGFGGIRNLSVLIGLYHSHDECLIHFIDDDCSLKNLTYENGQRKFSHAFNFFGEWDELFQQNPELSVAGGGYTNDTYETPWVVVHFLWTLRLFLEEASRHSSDDVIGPELWNKIMTMKKPWTNEYYDFYAFMRNLTYSKMLKIFSASCSIMKDYGSYRVIPTIYLRHKPNLIRSAFLSGGNVVFRRQVLKKGVPYPVGGWRGEDVTWSFLMDKIVGGVNQVILPVGHFRTHAGKRNIEDEFGKAMAFDVIGAVMYYAGSKHSIHDIVHTFRYDINRNNLNELSSFPETWYLRGDFADFGFQNWEKLAGETKTIIDSITWLHEQKFTTDVNKINDFLGYVKNPEIIKKIKSAVPPITDVIDACNNYAGLIENWSFLLDALEQMKTIHKPEDEAYLQPSSRIKSLFKEESQTQEPPQHSQQEREEMIRIFSDELNSKEEITEVFKETLEETPTFDIHSVFAQTLNE